MGSETKGHLRPQKRHCKLRHITLRATTFKHEIGTLLVIFQENSKLFFFFGGGGYLFKGSYFIRKIWCGTCDNTITVQL